MRVMLWALHFAEYSALLASALHELGCGVTLVLYEDNASREIGPDFRPLIEGRGVIVEVLKRPRSPADVLRNAVRLRGVVRDCQPDVIHVQEDGRDEMVLALMALKRMPVVLTVHDPAPHSGLDARRHRFHRARLYQLYLRHRADRAITHGQALAQQLARLVPAVQARVCVIPHGPLGLLRPTGTRQRPGPGRPARLLFFGRIHAYKGLRYFIEAVRTLHDQGLAVVGIVAGRGSDLEPHRGQMAAADCFELRERYIDAVETAELFTTADLVVLPYTDATQSGVAAMALGYGVPVIATTVGSIPEFVRDGVNGYLVPPRDSAALAQAVRRLLDAPEEYSRLSRNALALRDGELSWSRIAEQTLHCYRESETPVLTATQ